MPSRMETPVTQTDLIQEHRAVMHRFRVAPEGTFEHDQAEAALVASFARLNDRLFEETGEDCAFLRPQVGPIR